jgi:hypothetical protein
MAQLTDYLLGQMQQTLHSIESAQHDHSEKLDELTDKVEEARSWAQRLVMLALGLLAALGLNASPDKIGEAVAQFLRALR